MSEYLKEKLRSGVDIEKITPLDFKSYNELLLKIKNDPPPVILPTPFKKYNELIGGYEGGQLIVIGAPPKQGKSTFVVSMMYQMAKQNQKTLLFSYEMSWKEVTRKIEHMERFDGIVPGSIPRPLFLPMELDRGGDKLQLQWLLEAIAKAKESGVKLIAIDHLHFLIPYQESNNFSIVVGNVVRQIKNLAVMFEIPIILIVPMKNLQQERKPSFWDIRDSSMIMHEADDVMIMYRARKEASKKISDTEFDDDYINFSILSLELTRREGGKTGKIILFHNGGYFEESDPSILKMAMQQKI